MGKTIVILLFIIASATAEGQPFYFRHYQVENGLSNNAVICSAQDKQGFLWFGTKDGLDRFDGYSFKVFRYSPNDKGSIGSNFIHSLFEDSKGILWVGTESGIYRYDATTESFSALPTGSSGAIRDIVEDKEGNLWFISTFTLTRYNRSRGSFDYFDPDRYFEATSICFAEGSIWVASSKGILYCYDSGNNRFTSFDMFAQGPRTVNPWIEKLYTDGKGRIFVGTAIHGAKLFDINTSLYRNILTYNPDRTEVFARNFIEASPGEYWIGTESGVFIFNLQTGELTNLKRKYNDPYSISDNAVYTFCKDKEGGIWTGTYFGGINYYPKQYNFFKKYFPKSGENSLSGHVAREIHQDKYGNVWIGTENAGLNKLDTATGLFTHFQPTGTKGSISYTNIHGMLVNDNELWIGTFEHGLDVLDILSGKIIRHYSEGTGPGMLRSNFIYCIYKTPQGAILLGTTRGAYQYNRSKDNFSLIEGLPVNWFSSILQDKNGILWAGTYGNGIYFYNNKTKQAGNFRYAPADRQSIGSNRVNSIFEDSQARLWIATEGGLCLFDPSENRFRTYTINDGLPSNFILSLLEDNEQKLWVTTSKGLVCFDPAKGAIKTFTKDNGLLNDQFNFSSAYKDAKGRMYFGSVKGLISFDPSLFTSNSFIPPVYITGFQIFDKDIMIGKKGSPLQKSITYTSQLVLKHNQSTFSIDFAALGYTSPEMTEYAYKMEGLDKEWTYLKANRKAYFTELPPNNYLFKVKAANSSGVWNQLETTLAIEIRPPWWLSPWAYAAYTIAALFIIIYSIRNYHRSIAEKNRRKIEQLEIAKEKEIFQAKIDFFTNVAHEIRTPLTLIKGPLEKVIRKAGDQPEIKDSLRIMNKNTERLIDLTNQLIDFRQTEIKGFSLSFVQASISELLEETFISFKPLAEQRRLSFTIAMPLQKIHAFIDVEGFTKILTNLLSNAVKYALSKVHITLAATRPGDQFFTIEIFNDGFLIPIEMKEKIFEPFYRLKETEKQKGTGIGLALSRSLTQLHKGVLELRPAVGEMNHFTLLMPIHQDVEIIQENHNTDTKPVKTLSSKPD